MVSQGLLFIVIVIGIYLCAVSTILVKRIGKLTFQGNPFPGDFGDVAMIPFNLSNTSTLLICDFIPGTRRRGAKSKDGIHSSVTTMAEKEGIVVTESVPLLECDGPDGKLWYQCASVRHTPRRKDRHPVP